MAVVENRQQLIDDEEEAFKLQLEFITRTEEKRLIAERDEIHATMKQYEMYKASEDASRRSAVDEEYARNIQVNQEERGMELYSHYPGLDLVKGDRHSSVPSRLTSSSVPAASRGENYDTNNSDDTVESPYQSPKNSPKNSPVKKNERKGLFSFFSNSGKEEKQN